MKFLSKINRGALVTAGVVLAVIVYLIAHAVAEEQEKPAVRQVCEAYLQQEVAYNMLPEAYRADKPAIAEKTLAEYLQTMKADISAFYPDNEQYYKYVVENLEYDLTEQAKGNGVVFRYEKTILTYDKMVFDGDTVNVTLTCDTTLEAEDRAGSSVKQKDTAETADSIILQKIGGQWKVIYASINRPNRVQEAPGYKY